MSKQELIEREQKVLGIYLEADRELLAELHGTEDITLLLNVVRAREEDRYALLEALGISEKEMVVRVRQATVISAKYAITYNILNQLLARCNTNNNPQYEIPIDSTGLLLPPAHQTIYKNSQDFLDIYREGHTLAVKHTLTLLEGEITLGRYQYYLVYGKQGFLKKTDGYKFGTIPTKVKHVDLCLKYKDHEEDPSLSLLVKPFRATK